MEPKDTPPSPSGGSDEPGTSGVQAQITALRADMQRLQERITALQGQVATAMSETPAIHARINEALNRLAAAQQKNKPKP